ncbi:MAG: MFS transporter [bacterium]|nr:MFS transporter [bacterium]
MWIQLLKICLVAFLLDFAVMAGITALPFYAMGDGTGELGGKVVLAGVLGGVHAAAYAVTCLISSRYVHHAKNGLSLATWGIAVFAVSFGALPFLKNAWVCGASLVIASVALALVWPSLHSWVGAEPDPKKRSRNMGWFNISWSSGFALSPIAAGMLYDREYHLPFILLFVMGGLAFLIVRTLPRESEFYDKATEEMLLDRADHDRASEVFLYAAWCAVFTANALAQILRSVFPARIEELVGSGELRWLFESEASALLSRNAATKFGFLSFAMAFATMMVFLVVGHTKWWHHRFSVLAGIQVAAAGAFVVLGYTQSYLVMAACLAVNGAALGMAFFSAVYYSMGDPTRKHGRAAINEFAIGVGGFVGCVGVGYLVDRLGHTLAYSAATPIFVAMALVLQAVMLWYGAVRARRIDAQTT